MSALLGQRVKVLTGPCSGLIGVVTEVKRAVSGALTGELRVAFSPPVRIDSVGALSAVWRKTTDLEILRGRGQADA
jgi:hypothetical protein